MRQPWASALVEGIKDVENRTWPPYAPRPDLANPLSSFLVAIHASKARDPKATYAGPFLSLTPERYQRLSEAPVGAIIGVVRIVDTIPPEGSAIRGYHGLAEASPWWQSWCWGWVVSEPIRFREPIYCNGRLGLWRLSDQQVRQIRQRMEER